MENEDIRTGPVGIDDDHPDFDHIEPRPMPGTWSGLVIVVGVCLLAAAFCIMILHERSIGILFALLAPLRVLYTFIERDKHRKAIAQTQPNPPISDT